MDNEGKKNLEILLQGVAKKFNLKINSLNLLTNQNPTIIKIIICNINNDDITLDDCSRFNIPAATVIENSNHGENKEQILIFLSIPFKGPY